MEDQSIYTNSQPGAISEGLQHFIDSMVEEIVISGKPFESQKKYLKKYSENEGLDYQKLEEDINAFIMVLDSLRIAFSKVQVQLAEEKGRECHISEETLQKLVNHSSQPRPKKAKKPAPEVRIGSEKKPNLKYLLYGCLGLFVIALILFVLMRLRPVPNPDPVIIIQHDTIAVNHVQVKHDTIIRVQYSTEAEQKYREAAERGDANAQFNLGSNYYSGTKGLPQSYSEAIRWYAQAANQGHAAAQNNLGYCYEKGYGVKQDYAKAIEWYTKALENGSNNAQSNLERLKQTAKDNNKTVEISHVSAPKGKENGHEWIDLGLPSGLKWATCNVGASAPSEYGYYYAWAEVSTKSKYAWTNLSYCSSGDALLNVQFSKYNTRSDRGVVDSKKRLELSDDAARQNWHGKWRMPTKSECEELINSCSWQRKVLNGINGVEGRGPNGGTIFLPMAGTRNASSNNESLGKYGSFWSSSLDTGFTPCACDVSFGSEDPHLGSEDRRYGQSVRPVIDL